ncbi:MAG: prolipoprotein diacylglyceryl transferase [Bacteroidales bacterium]|nr:prolipoprotein diacylglyceryl transferase [Bacteroidales bacterium]
MEKIKVLTGKVLYGFLFVAVIPSLLVLWAEQSGDIIKLPVLEETWPGYLLLATGIALIAAGMLHLWFLGKGLPMNAFPPERLVTRGVYAFTKHPIYAGAVLVSFGLSVSFQSSSGLWLVSPFFTLMTAAWVEGFENERTKEVFGDQEYKTFLSVPVKDTNQPSVMERISSYLVVFVPLLIVYNAWTFSVASGEIDVIKLPFGEDLSIRQLSNAFYIVELFLALAVPVIIRTRVFLRIFITSMWTAVIIAGLICFAFPVAMKAFNLVWAFVVAGYFATGLRLNGWIWDLIKRQTEKLANSWREWRIGPVRIINHGFYGGAAGLAGTLIAGFFLGQEYTVIGFTVMIFVIIGAGLWAQFIEGSPKLLRPYGYYGGLIGGLTACLLASLIFQISFFKLVASFAMAAPWIQATGRLRCLVQGCCHGKPSDPSIGIRFTHPLSRVNKISGLNGVALHPTQLYSITCNLISGTVLIWLYNAGMPAVFICGIYLMLNGLGRFVEESLRGEAQTPYLAGMRIYQWIAIINIMLGALCTTINDTSTITFQFNIKSVFLAVLMGIIVMFASGVDFPSSNRRFARLTST